MKMEQTECSETLATLCLFYLHKPMKIEETECSETLATLCLFHLHRPMKMGHSVPKSRRIKFRRWGIIQKKAYNVQNRAKI